MCPIEGEWDNALNLKVISDSSPQKKKDKTGCHYFLVTLVSSSLHFFFSFLVWGMRGNGYFHHPNRSYPFLGGRGFDLLNLVFLSILNPGNNILKRQVVQPRRKFGLKKLYDRYCQLNGMRPKWSHFAELWRPTSCTHDVLPNLKRPST